MQDSPAGDGSIGTRWPEAIVALLMLAVAAVIITDSVRIGTGWADDGPMAGYFPFYIGLLLAASGGWVLLTTLLRWRQEDPEFSQRSQMARVVAILVPTAIYVVLVGQLGIYLASFLLIGYFMRRYGQYKWRLVAAVAVGVPLVFFLVFEKWFLVPLPKGPIERLLGM